MDYKLTELSAIGGSSLPLVFIDFTFYMKNLLEVFEHCLHWINTLCTFGKSPAIVPQIRDSLTLICSWMINLVVINMIIHSFNSRCHKCHHFDLYHYHISFTYFSRKKVELQQFHIVQSHNHHDIFFCYFPPITNIIIVIICWEQLRKTCWFCLLLSFNH